LFVSTVAPGCLYFLAGAAGALREVFFSAAEVLAAGLPGFLAMFSVSVSNLLFDNNPINFPFFLCSFHKKIKNRIIRRKFYKFASKRVNPNCGIVKNYSAKNVLFCF